MSTFWTWAKKILRYRAPAPPTNPPPPPPAPPAADPQLVSPFSARRNGDTFEISDSNGVIAIWCRGERVTRMFST